MLNDFLTRNFPSFQTAAPIDPAIVEERHRQIEADRSAALEAEIRLTESIVFVAPNGDRFLPFQKAGALRNGNELGKGSVFHAVAIEDGKTANQVHDQEKAICGTFPSIMWSTAYEGDVISCPRCLKKLGRLLP